MAIISEIIDIKNNGNPNTEYIENELRKRRIEPLRWAIVDITEEIYTINVAYENS